MKRIKVLDCTLRDGGYVTNWEVGSLGFDIVKSLYDSNIEECIVLIIKIINGYK